MMSHAGESMMCMDENGQKRPHKDKWEKDDCTVCRCRVSILGRSSYRMLNSYCTCI